MPARSGLKIKEIERQGIRCFEGYFGDGVIGWVWGNRFVSVNGAEVPYQSVRFRTIDAIPRSSTAF